MRINCFLAFLCSIGLIISCSRNSEVNPEYNLVIEDNLYGYINTKGEFAIKPTFLYASNFSEGLAIAVVDSTILKGGLSREIEYTYGYVNQKGQFVIKPKLKIKEYGISLWPRFLDDKFCFHDGMAAYRDESGKYGFINRKGKAVIKPDFEDIKTFSNGLAVVKMPTDTKQLDEKSNWGVIDTKGNLVVDYIYQNIQRYHENRAIARIETKRDSVGFMMDDGTIKKDLMKYYTTFLLDEKGHVISELDNIYEYGHCSEGIIPASASSLAQFMGKGCAFFDANGNLSNLGRDNLSASALQKLRSNEHYLLLFENETMLTSVTPFNERFAIGKVKGKYIYISRANFALFGKSDDAASDDDPLYFAYDEANPFFNGRAKVKVGGLYGYIDENFEYVIPPQYTRASDFHNNLALVQRVNGKVIVTSYINKEGEVVYQKTSSSDSINSFFDQYQYGIWQSFRHPELDD